MRPQAKLKIFAAALQRAAAAAQRVPTKGDLILKGLSFGSGALANSMSAMLGSVSRFQSKYNNLFPGVLASAGAAGGR